MKNANFKKNNEILLGLDFGSLVKISVCFIILIFLAINLNTAIDSPLFIFLLILTSVISAFVIKSSRGDEIAGFYMAYILHPLQEMIYHSTPNTLYKSLQELNNITEVKQDHLVTKQKDLVGVIKINKGFCYNRADPIEIETILQEWKNLLIELHKTNILDSYFFTSSQQEGLHFFMDINNYQYPHQKIYPLNQANLLLAEKHHQDWYSAKSMNHKFIPEINYFILLKEKNPLKHQTPLKYKLAQFLKKELIPNELEQIDQKKIFEQKLDSLIGFCEGSKISGTQIKNDELKAFSDKYLIKSGDDKYLQDHGKFLENNFQEYRFSKTYRFTGIPSAQDFWLKELIKKINSKTQISFFIETRNTLNDRYRALSKLKNYQRTKSFKSDEIDATKKIFLNLSQKPYSYDFSFLITIFSNDLSELKKLDREFKKPFCDVNISGLERMQIKNFISNQASFNNILDDKEKIFTDLDSITPSFPLLDKQLGTTQGPLLGLSLDDERPIFFDEYNRNQFHNRAINYIGDSGSGKTVAAKLNIMRRLADPEKSFFIIDNTEDGWEFFINYYSGQKIDIDSSTSLLNSLFSPLVFSQNIDINDQIDKCLELFKLLQNNGEKLDFEEKIFLGESLKELYRRKKEIDLSDYLLFLRNKGCAQENLLNKWSKIFYPYCKISNGIYSGLLDNKNSQIKNRLTLFTFSKINSNKDYHNASIFLISDFITNALKNTSKNTLVIDEAWKLLKNNKNPMGSELICHLARAGRGLDLGLWTISQKPSDIPPEIHSSASSTLCFQLKERQDRDDLVKFANLNTNEEKFLSSIHLTKSGNAFLKTTIDSGLIRLELDPLEKILTCSVREFSNLRKSIYEKNLALTNCTSTSALKTVEEILQGSQQW
jgi:hypothetical protein